MGGIVEDGKAGTNIQEGRQRGGRKLQRSGDVCHGQPNPRSCFANTFEVVGQSICNYWMTTRKVSDRDDQQRMQHK